MYLNILSKEQEALLPWLKSYRNKFVLAGGTAMAIQIGHRRSIDFDLFSTEPIKKADIKRSINTIPYDKQLLFEDSDQIHYLVNQVKLTFLYYPFPVKGTIDVGGYISIPDLSALAAMKFHAMGRRAKWKDYVDIFCLLNKYFSIPEISKTASEMFHEAYSEKLFRQQLSYFEDIDYSESIEWVETRVEDQMIKERLIDFALKL